MAPALSLSAVAATQDQHEKRLTAVERAVFWILTTSILTLLGIVVLFLKVR